MNNSLSNYQTSDKSHRLKICLHLLAAIFLILAPILIARGQKPDAATTVSSVSSHSQQNGIVVQISGNGSLTRAQTFQDADGFHVIIPDAGMSDRVQSSKGIKVHTIGNATEVLLQSKPGTPITVQAIDNRLSLSIEGKLDLGQGEAAAFASPSGYSLPKDYSASTNSSLTSSVTAENSPAQPSQQSAASSVNGTVSPGAEDQTVNERHLTKREPDAEGVWSWVFSGTGLLVGLIFAVVALIVTPKLLRRKRHDGISSKETGFGTESKNANSDKPKEARTEPVRDNRTAPLANPSTRERQEVGRQVATGPASHFGAYRIDQEVCNLVLGQPHRIEVLSSRAPDDRTAIQASLIKAIATPELSDEQCRRAREALEEYGFVARDSATVLLANDPFARMSAAQSLGKMGCSAALPFLLEGLYDAEPLVRNQAVVSIGELKVPSAIGALLDIARKHPEVPSNLVSRALSACSVDGVASFGAIPATAAFIPAGTNEGGTFDFVQLDQTSFVAVLPDTLDDEGLRLALANAQNESAEARSAAVKSLGQYPAKDAVETLIRIARQDPEASLRALAVSGLALIDHESVFPAVLIGMADDSREVRAAAARVFSRLSFDRSKAYVSVIQTTDNELVREVAQACIKAGIVSQNIDRLATCDRRQAHEAFCLISLLAKAKMTEPMIDAIEHHSNLTVRVSVVHLLATTAEEFVFEQLQTLILKDGLDEQLKTALLEGMYKLEQVRKTSHEPVEAFVIRENHERSERREDGYETGGGFDCIVRTEVDELEL